MSRSAPSTAAVYGVTAPGTTAPIERELAQPVSGEVILQVHANGVCASELHDWADAPGHLPIWLGHEPVGQVSSAPAGSRFAVGDWVTGRVEPSFARFVVASEADLVPVPDGLDPDDVLGEPVGCVVEGLRRTPVESGARVAVIGTGFMGLVMTQLLGHSLASHVHAIDPRADARAVALDNGADVATAPDLAGDGRFDERFDVVIEASGTQGGLDLATALVRQHGVLSILGYHQGPRTVAMDQWNFKALDVVNAHVRDHALMLEGIRRGVELQAAGRIDPGRLITHRFTPDRIDDAFETLRSKPEGFVKAVIMFGD